MVGSPRAGASNVSTTTTSDAGRRKLIAVLYADMVGYSRLIGLDDAGTLERLRALRRDLIDPAIEEHGGTVVQTAATRCWSRSAASTARYAAQSKCNSRCHPIKPRLSRIGPSASAWASTSAMRSPTEPIYMAMR